jgi:hypothetical protein
MSLRKLSFGVREIGGYKELCQSVQALSENIQKENSYRRHLEIDRLKVMLPWSLNLK